MEAKKEELRSAEQWRELADFLAGRDPTDPPRSADCRLAADGLRMLAARLDGLQSGPLEDCHGAVAGGMGGDHFMSRTHPLTERIMAACSAMPDSQLVRTITLGELRQFAIALGVMGREAPSFDVEAMLRACVPGGSICDPQQVADAIRAYFADGVGIPFTTDQPKEK